MKNEYSTNLADFKLASSLDGKLSLVWAEPKEHSSDLNTVFFDPIYNVWGDFKQLTFDAEIERNITAAFYGTDTLISVYNRDVLSQSSNTMELANGKLVTLNKPEIISTDLYMLKYTIGKDLALESGSLTSLPQNPEIGTDITLTVKAMNLGDESVVDVPVGFYLGNPSSGGIQIGEKIISGIFKPGDTVEVSVLWTVPDTSPPISIYSVIDPFATFDPVNRFNNVDNIELVKTDLLVKAVNWNISMNRSISLTTRITNGGVISSGPTSVKFRKDSAEGDLIYEEDLNPLVMYESVDINHIWDISGLSSKTYTIFVIIDEENNISEFNEENNIKIVTIEEGTTDVATIHVFPAVLNFGATTSGIKTPDQQFRITNTGGGTLNWTVTDNADWLTCSDPSVTAPLNGELTGNGNAVINVSVDPSKYPSDQPNGTITVSDPNSSNLSKSVEVALIIKDLKDSTIPFGFFDTPIDGTSGITGACPVTGWVLDDIGIQSVKIYRDPVSSEGSNIIYIGDAVFVEGSRPDVEQLYPDYPLCYKAGWGYMILTNFLPGQGNDTYKIHAFATDLDGHTLSLGTKTIHCDNANATKPFGAIDTPTQGGEASGLIWNYGWALAPPPYSLSKIPEDGSTIGVWLDGQRLGHPDYGQYRDDIAKLFPGYANSNGAGGAYLLDTTTYTNGVHTIAWSVKDNAGNSEGIGSRFFTIANTGGSAQAEIQRNKEDLSPSISYESILNMPINFNPLKFKRGYKQETEPEIVRTDEYGLAVIEIKEVDRIEIELGKGVFAGYLVVGDQLRPLPIGSTLDVENGKFYWQLGPGFIGDYDLVFIKVDELGMQRRLNVKIKIRPKFGIYRIDFIQYISEIYVILGMLIPTLTRDKFPFGMRNKHKASTLSI